MPASPVKDLGPCSVLWDPTPGANVELNPTFGGVIFRSEDAVVDILEDGRGTTPIDAVFTGRVASLEVPMTRTTLAKLNKILPGSVAGANNLKVSTHVGAAMFASSKPIIVKPIVDNIPSVTTTEWLHIHHAYPVPGFEVTYDNAGQRVFRVTFKVFPSETSGMVGELWRIGPA